jgi:hypothetical protein
MAQSCMCEARVEDREGWVLEVSVAGPVFGLYVFVASAVCVLLLLMRLRPAVGGHTHVLVCDSPNTVLGLPVLLCTHLYVFAARMHTQAHFQPPP